MSLEIINDSNYIENTSLSLNRINIELPNNCKNCDLNNFYIWGTIINGKIKTELRCMRCGNIISIYKKTKSR
jgi:hypothetical protein